MAASFLRDKLGWIGSDLCWWCRRARQTREHLFKECRTWKKAMVTLWKDIGEISDAKAKVQDGEGEDGAVRPTKHVYKGKKGFGFGVRATRARPGNTSVTDLFSREEYVSCGEFPYFYEGGRNKGGGHSRCCWLFFFFLRSLSCSWRKA